MPTLFVRLKDMKIDIVSVFPEYFEVLNLSLFGKAQAKGLIEVHAHNLRDWTHDVHHSVDDTPVGGGAGMVMKPAVWAECLDDLLGLEPRGAADSAANQASGVQAATDPANQVSMDRASGAASSDITTSEAVTCDLTTPDAASSDVTTPDAAASGMAESCIGSVCSTADEQANTHCGEPGSIVAGATPGTVLIFPNPSAPLFTQRDATELSRARRLVFGCGRYEGYDARIPEYYRAQGVDVREYSIGDYVLNGGEVAVSVMLEAITRLLPGFMGNPESIVEESYTGGNALLEHRQYTKPAVWRGMGVPEILLSGDHGKVDRFRRDEALARTNDIRPDLIARLDCRALDKADRKTLIALGWEVSGEHPRRLGA